MYCPNCNQEYEGKFCPECGTKLIEKPTGGFNLNLGDANAISGGVNMSDSHNVHNEDKSVHNTSNVSNVTNNTTHNITNVAAQKTSAQELQDKKRQFNLLLEEVFADNQLTAEEETQIKKLQIELNLDDETAQILIDNARRLVSNQTRKVSLGAAQGPVKQLTMFFLNNDVQKIKQLLPRMAALARNFKVDEVQHKYYMALAAIDPDKLIKMYEENLADNYWCTYWTYIAYRKKGMIEKAEDLLWGQLQAFGTYSPENITFLQCIGEIEDFGIDTAAETLGTVTENFSPELKRFANALYLFLDPQRGKKHGASKQNSAFYIENIIESPQLKAEKERIAEETRIKAEEERRRKEEVAKRQREAEEARKREEERRRLAEEARVKEEQEAKRKAEEERRRKEEEARKKAEAEAKAKPAVLTFTANGVSFNMIRVEGGTFTMGATPEMKDHYDDEVPTHKVTLSSYFMGETEVTQSLWKAVMGMNPSKFKGDNLPVECVSWNDCQPFISKLNSLTGKNFRLPTEAEWEFAARGGNNSGHTQYSGSSNIDAVAWYDDNSRKTHPVATKQANELGIYDMSGNVWEWCSDWYGEYSSSSQTNPEGPYSGTDRVLRGGSWSFIARGCRSSNRLCNSPGNRSSGLGLRLCLSE